MAGEPIKMRSTTRIHDEVCVAQNWLEPAGLQCGMPRSLVREEAEFGDEADIGQRHIIADQEPRSDCKACSMPPA